MKDHLIRFVIAFLALGVLVSDTSAQTPDIQAEVEKQLLIHRILGSPAVWLLLALLALLIIAGSLYLVALWWRKARRDDNG